MAVIYREGWHVGRSWPGMFPALEAECPCPKAPCGLAIPTYGIGCEHHVADRTIRQLHHPDNCTPWKFTIRRTS